MLEAHQGLCARLTEVNLQVKISHYILNRENLVSRKLWKELDIVTK